MIKKKVQIFNPAVVIATLIFCWWSIPQLQAQQVATEDQQSQVSVDVNQVKFMTEQNFMLAGKYYAGQDAQAGVLLLHDCLHDSSSYNELAEQLSMQGLHALAIDLRGYGDSISDDFSHLRIKRNANDIATYQSEFSRLTSYWQSDVRAAYQYLRSRISDQQEIAVVSAGCSAAQAVFLAEKIRINSFVMLTPIMNYMEKEHFKNLIDIPIYFISSIHHTDTFQTAKELFEWNGDPRSVTKIFKGIRQGQSLLKAKRFLAEDIALWLSATLAKN